MALGFGAGALLGLPPLLELSLGPTWLVAGSAFLLATFGYVIGRRESHLVASCSLDPKTRIPNRHAFIDRLAQEFDRAARHRQSLTMLLLEVEGDTEAATAAATRRLASLLRSTCRTTDFVAHCEGAQLAVLAPCTSAPQAGMFAERILDAAQAADGAHLSSLSIGVAQLRSATMRDPQALFESASQALLIAKLSGREVVVLDGGAAHNPATTVQPRWKMSSDREQKHAAELDRRRHGAAVRANEVVDADGHSEMELSVFCGECESWQPVLGRRRARWVERALHLHQGLPFVAAGQDAMVGEIMTRRVTCVRPDTSVTAVTQLFIDRDLSGAPVLDALGKVIGVVSRGDVLRGAYDAESTSDPTLASATVADVMTPIVFHLPPDATVSQAAALMAYEGIERIVVVSADSAVVGMLTSMDVLRWVAQHAGYTVPGVRDDQGNMPQPRIAPSLPARPTPMEQSAMLERQAPQLSGEILVVDDDDEMRNDVAELLRAEGYVVTTACNGQEALDRLRTSGLPRLILFDLQMPVMNGWSFYSELHKHPTLGRIPLVVLSGTKAQRAGATTLDVDGYLSKPVALDALLGTVKQYLC